MSLQYKLVCCKTNDVILNYYSLRPIKFTIIGLNRITSITDWLYAIFVGVVKEKPNIVINCMMVNLFILYYKYLPNLENTSFNFNNT